MPGRIDDFEEALDLVRTGEPERVVQRDPTYYPKISPRIAAVGVSGRFIPDENEFAARLINSSAAAQAKPEIVARNIARTRRILEDAQRDRVRPRGMATAHVNGRAFDFPRTVFGTYAWIGRRYFGKTSARGYTPQFVSRLLALPCVERQVRKEVMFAKKKAGKGYKVRHRRAPFTDIWC